jgi:hypothetical protein
MARSGTRPGRPARSQAIPDSRYDDTMRRSLRHPAPRFYFQACIRWVHDGRSLVSRGIDDLRCDSGVLADNSSAGDFRKSQTVRPRIRVILVRRGPSAPSLMHRNTGSPACGLSPSGALRRPGGGRSRPRVRRAVAPGNSTDANVKQPIPDAHQRPAARCTRGFVRNSRPANRGRGECRMPNAPAASCAKGSNMHTSIHSEAPENTRHSRTQWFYGLYALSPAS